MLSAAVQHHILRMITHECCIGAGIGVLCDLVCGGNSRHAGATTDGGSLVEKEYGLSNPMRKKTEVRIRLGRICWNNWYSRIRQRHLACPMYRGLAGSGIGTACLSLYSPIYHHISSFPINLQPVLQRLITVTLTVFSECQEYPISLARGWDEVS